MNISIMYVTAAVFHFRSCVPSCYCSSIPAACITIERSGAIKHIVHDCDAFQAQSVTGCHTESVTRSLVVLVVVVVTAAVFHLLTSPLNDEAPWNISLISVT